MWPGCSTSAAPTSLIRRCRWLSPSCRSRSVRRSVRLWAQAVAEAARLSRAARRRRRTGPPDRRSPGARGAGKAPRVRSGHRARPPDPGAAGGGRRGGPRRRSDHADEGAKNRIELEGARAAQLRDGAAIARFLAWIDREAPTGGLSEIIATRALETFRRETGKLKDISFPTIAGAGPNSAIPHYRVSEATNCRSRAAFS